MSLSFVNVVARIRPFARRGLDAEEREEGDCVRSLGIVTVMNSLVPRLSVLGAAVFARDFKFKFRRGVRALYIHLGFVCVTLHVTRTYKLIPSAPAAGLYFV